MSTTDFLTWLDAELEQRGWNDFQLSRRAGISHSAISRARRGGVLPSWEVCGAIARALDLPPEMVFRKAGLLPERPDDVLDFEQWQHVLGRLSEEDRQELLEIARLKLGKQMRQGGAGDIRIAKNSPRS